jgi:hypothetical protein
MGDSAFFERGIFFVSILCPPLSALSSKGTPFLLFFFPTLFASSEETLNEKE